jgi:hypothetical protein
MTMIPIKISPRSIPANRKSILSFINIFSLSILLLYTSCVGVDFADKNAPKPEKIVHENQAILELCVQKLFDHSWSETEVNTHLKSNKISAMVDFLDTEQRAVIFFVNGMIDNCVGFGYSEGQQTGQLCGGTASWANRIIGNWYQVSST